MSLMLRYPMSLIVVGFTTNDAKCNESIFKVCRLGTSTKKAVLDVCITVLKLGTMENMITSVMSYICTLARCKEGCQLSQP